MAPQFLTELVVQELKDDETWEVVADLKYYSDVLKQLLTVPVGFVTDFASVPKVPIVYEAFGNRAHHESVVHDYMYQTHISGTRALADKVFLEAMRLRGKPEWICKGMYWGVRLGGWWPWHTGPDRFTVLQAKKSNPDFPAAVPEAPAA